MKRQIILLIFAGGILFALLFLLLKLKNEETTSTHNQQLSDFAIQDTSSITKIIISEPDGQKAVVEKIGHEKWQLNGKYVARIDAMHVIFKTAKLVSVKSEVPNSALKTVLKNIAVTYKKVEYYAGETLIKTWYVGTPTRDHYGTYMLLEKPGFGKSTVPYILEIKGFFGHLASRFFTDEKEWRDKIIYKLQPNEISSIELKNNETPEYSFKIEVAGKNKFLLYDGKNRNINAFDTVSVRSYLLNFRKIAFEAFNRGILNEQQEDSLRKSIPFTIITVKDKSGNSTSIKAYRKAPTEDQVTLGGGKYQFDIEKLFAILPSGEIVIMQYGTFDKIWRALASFTP